MFDSYQQMRLVSIDLPQVREAGVSLAILREDERHPEISGNKWWKLKYNVEAAQAQGYDTLLTFGGAYSNHILATAALGHKAGFRTIGLIRGEQTEPLNPTLTKALALDMEIDYVDRSAYRKKDSEVFLKALERKYGRFFLLPEGGSNNLGVRGCMEILNRVDELDVVACACGTGATLAGLAAQMDGNGSAVGFSVLKGGQFLENDVHRFFQGAGGEERNWHIEHDYHFGGYAKHTPELVDFIRSFRAQTGIPLDPIYTGKALFGLLELIERAHFPKRSRIVFVHTGGLQGIDGWEQRLGIPL